MEKKLKLREKLTNVKVEKKLKLFSSVAIGMIAILGLASFLCAALMNMETNNITKVWVPSLTYAKDMDILAFDYRMKQYGHLTATTDEKMAEFDAELTSIEQQMDEKIALFKSVISEPEETQMLNDAEALWDEYVEMGHKLIEMSHAQQVEEGAEYMLGEMMTTYNTFSDLFAKLVEFEQEKTDESAAMARNVFFLVIVVIIAVVAVGFVVIRAITKIITGIIVEPVNQIMQASEAMTRGELSASDIITYEAEDEFGDMAKAIKFTMVTLDAYVKEICTELDRVAHGDLTKDFNEITDFLGDFASIKASFVTILSNFNQTLQQIQEVSKQVDVGSNDIAGAASSLAEGTSEQAGAVEELTATVIDISGMAKRSAEETEKAHGLMLEAVERAEKEREQMKMLQAEMQNIKDISREIEAIVTTIEEIATQTSLLALNASIEAARAGEAGRGFAVVADQIGKLATDSAQAVISTKELITTTVEEIDKGNAITIDTVESFDKIIEEINMFASSAKENSVVSKNQADALAEVEKGIEQISSVTQDNAASSEESNAISEELAARATELDDLIARFRLFE